MFSGLQEAVLKNIDACKELSLLTKSSMGPNGEQPVVSISHIPCASAVVILRHWHSMKSLRQPVRIGRQCCLHHGV